MQIRRSARSLDDDPDDVPALSGAAACPGRRPQGRVPRVSPSSRRLTPEETLALVLAEARLVAEKGKVPEGPLVEQLTDRFAQRQEEVPGDAAEVRKWAMQNALAIAAADIAAQRALEMARRKGFAEETGLSPDDVAQFVRKQLHEHPPGPFATVGGLRAWAGKVAINMLRDALRHLRVVRRAEDQAEEIIPAIHAIPPRSAERLAAEYHDVPRQVAIIAFYLGKPKNLLVRQFCFQVQASMLGQGLGDAGEVARALGARRSTVYKNRAIIRRTVRDLQRAGVIDLDVPAGEAEPETEDVML